MAKMYVIICVLYAIMEFVVCEYFPVHRLKPWNNLHNHDNEERKWQNKYKMAGSTVCCCKSPDAPKRNKQNDYFITLVNNNEAVNCTEERNNFFTCYCYLSLRSTTAQKNVNDNSCTNSIIDICIGVAAVILLMALLICIILLLRKKTGFKIDKLSMVRCPPRNKKRITIIRRSLKTNSNATPNDLSDDTITRIKYGSLRNNRAYSHVYHSLDNLHMATEDSTPVINLNRYRNNIHGRIPKDGLKQVTAQRVPLNDYNVTYEQPMTSAPNIDEYEVHNRRPFPLPHENVPPANNLNISQSHTVESTKPLPPPPNKSLRPAPQTPTSPIMADTSPMTSELINLFNKRRQNANESLVRPRFTPTLLALPPTPPHKPNKHARPPASNLYNNEDDDWTYEEYINVSIYDVK